MATYDVYLASYIGLPAYHDAIYVETKKDERGWLFHAIGDNVNGYRFEKKATDRPENSRSFSKKLYKGKVAAADLSKMEEICRKVPPEKEEIIGGVSFRKNCRHYVQACFDQLSKPEGPLKK